jgi:predicted metal-binding membrane protein
VSTPARLPLRDRIAMLAGVAGAVILSWTYLVSAGLDMYDDMDGLAAWMMQPGWDLSYFLLMFLMWAVMMLGMMLPSAFSAIQLYTKVVRSSPEPRWPVVRSYAFATGYLLVWSAFSFAATLLQWQLAKAALMSPMMVAASPMLGAAILMLAGVYQWAPLKQSCLDHCRSPLDYLQRNWRPDIWGALQIGIGHGLFCLGCCWALMLLLFFGGVMNLLWIAGITAFVLIEKLLPFGDRVGRIGGLLMFAAGIAVLIISGHPQ